MLQKITFKLRCTEPGTVLGHAGSELHALLFAALKAADEDYATSLHDLAVKPFALGPLTGRADRDGGRLNIVKENLYSFELAALDAAMTAHLPAIEAHLVAADLRLGGARFSLEDARPLFKKPQPYFKMMARSEEADSVSVTFKSPTCFRRDGRLNLFPLPGMLLHSLANKWAQFSDVALPEYNPANIIAAHYGLKTSLVRFDKYNLVGFHGFCKYSFTAEARDIDRWVMAVLLNYGTLAGIGYKTTMGMGQVRVK